MSLLDVSDEQINQINSACPALSAITGQKRAQGESGLGNIIKQIRDATNTLATEILQKDLSDQVDGVKVLFNVGESYLAGSLKVYIDGARVFRGTDTLNWRFSETDPIAGTFTMSIAPETSEELYVEYLK